MDRWPLVAGRLWMLSAWHCVVVQPHHGCIERWSLEQWSLIDARLLGDGRFLKFEEKTLSSLIQTGESFSSNLKHGSMVGDGRSLRRTDIIDRNLQY